MGAYGGWIYGAGKYGIGATDAQASLEAVGLFVCGSVEKIKEASALSSATSMGSVYGEGAYGSGQFGNRYVGSVRVRQASATVQGASQIESVAFTTRGVSALVSSTSSASASAVFSIVASASVNAQSNVTASASRIQKTSVLMSNQSSMIVVARKKWENQADTPETWTVIPDTSEIWTSI